jgi:hypothetical protein
MSYDPQIGDGRERLYCDTHREWFYEDDSCQGCDIDRERGAEDDRSDVDYERELVEGE